MKMNCYIIDDENHAIEVLKRYIAQTPGLDFAGSETNPLVGLNSLLSNEIVADITFVDIDMPQLSGIDLAELITSKTLVIFTTAFADYAVSAFEKNALDYMLKPISYERFLKSIAKAQEKFIAKINDSPAHFNNDYFYIQAETKGKLIKILHDDVAYIESMQNYVRINLHDKSYLTYLTMKEMEDKLPKDNFLRIHKSFIVNMQKFQSVESNIITLQNGKSFPLGTNYRDDFLKSVDSKLLKSKRSS